ncbi:ribonuclease [Pelistega indica]|uniref:Ribonuclease n=1 Tax=Pelistega indica TaxID=1414851 RepID=V8G380_9BURK|nr:MULTISPECIES: ribonuclease domain-containing protein [Pelistega]ETD70423.1 ribonuclease [Pelistega indica]
MLTVRNVIFVSLMSLSVLQSGVAWSLAKKPSSQDVSVLNQSSSSSCEVVIEKFNKEKLKGQINVDQLVDIIRSLNANNQLPNYFITKKRANEFGWRPGMEFNKIDELRGKSIGGDKFGNFEKRLPLGQWQEADLDYRGKKRNAKRIVFNREGERYVTIDHYESFYQVPACK